MKKVLSLLLTFAMLAGTLVFSAVYSSADVETVEIKSVADLETLRSHSSAHAVLTSDLVISGSSWVPIGTSDAPFAGSFHGCGHKITLDLDVSGSAENMPVGVFGYVTGSITCLDVTGTIDANVTNGAFIGTAAAVLKDGGSVTNCRSDVAITVVSTKACAVGGIVGEVANTSAATDGTISYCRNTGAINVSGTTGAGNGDLGSSHTNGAVGGILGFSASQAKSVLSCCLNEGTITINGWKYNVGGIVGQNSSNNTATTISITECANKGDITIYNLTGERAAGIIGYIKGGTVNYCYNLGMIRAYSDNGNTPSRNGYGTNFGIFGYANLGNSNKLTVKFCYNGTESPLEAEICTVRNPSYGTFQNYYMSGREEYETALNSNAKAGTAGTAFTDAADLTTKIVAAAGGKYVENAGSYPKLAFENSASFNAAFTGATWSPSGVPTFTTGRSNVGTCPICSQTETIEAIPATLGWHSRALADFSAGNSSVTVIGTISDADIDLDSADELQVTVAFSTGGQVVKTKEATFRTVCSTVIGCASVNASTAQNQGVEFVGAGLIFGLRVVNIPDAVYNIHVTVNAALNGATVATAEADYGDIFMEYLPKDLKVGADLPKYTVNSTVSPVYNAGTGLASDRYGTTDTDCLEVVVSGANAAEYTAYLQDMADAGFTQVFSNTVEGNDYRIFQKNGNTYYFSFQPSTNLLRVVADKASTGLVTDLTGGNGTVEPVIYQYALDFTKTNSQTSGSDYWAIDCGMCYIIRLADNSLFLIDGGHQRQSSDAALDALNDYLHAVTNTPAGGTVHISGWFFSHPHGDHVYMTHAFLEKYHAQYTLDAVFCNFPSYQTAFSGNYDNGTFLMKDTVNAYYPDCDFYKLHTGETFSLPGVDFEVIFTHEDAVQASGSTSFTDCNNASTVIRTTIGGKTVMFLGDINTSAQSVILGRYSSTTLKSDAVQMAHHCINNVPSIYNAIAAPLLLCPQSKENVQLNSSKTTNHNNAVNAAGNSYRTTLYEGDYNYLLTFDGDEIAYETAGELYANALYFEMPSILQTYTGTTTAESPIDASLLTSLTDLSGCVIAKSASGTAGTSAGESPQCIFDGKTSTKWCETSTASPYVMFKTSVPVTVDAYALYAANDTANHTGRNPKCWTLWGSADGESWTAIDAVYNGQMNTANYSQSAYAAGAQVAGCSYFVLVIHSTVDGTTMQISELQLYGTVS